MKVTSALEGFKYLAAKLVVIRAVIVFLKNVDSIYIDSFFSISIFFTIL